jgi:hypothetical protein
LGERKLERRDETEKVEGESKEKKREKVDGILDVGLYY